MHAILLIFGLFNSYAEEAGNETSSEIELSDTISGKEAPILQIDDLQMSSEAIFEDALVGKYPERIKNGAKWFALLDVSSLPEPGESESEHKSRGRTHGRLADQRDRGRRDRIRCRVPTGGRQSRQAHRGCALSSR